MPSKLDRLKQIETLRAAGQSWHEVGMALDSTADATRKLWSRSLTPGPGPEAQEWLAAEKDKYLETLEAQKLKAAKRELKKLWRREDMIREALEQATENSVIG